MTERINEILDTLPKLPGIYMMKDEKGEILYIGKAKSLFSRVRSYFQNSRNHMPRSRAMIAKIFDIKVLTTESEREALILESNFIKKYQPRYNVLLKDDKHYPYIRLTIGEIYPRLEIVRKVKKDSSAYFGPYTMVKEVRETIRLIYKIFPLRQSKDELDGAEKRRPCLNYQMGRCLAPCSAKVSPSDYSKIVKDVQLFLKGKNAELMESLKAKMLSASEATEYEKAAVYRDKISSVKTIFDKQKVVSTSQENHDAIAYYREGDSALVQVLIIREGKLIGEKNVRLKSQKEFEDNEILTSFLKQYYANEPMLPKEILLPHPVEDQNLLSDWLSEIKGSRLTLESPSIGKKRNLVKMAASNAKLALKNELDDDESRVHMLEELQTQLHLKSLPQTIEGFDISNISGTYAVGSMVSFNEGKAEKANYRRFKIKDVQGIDDYAMLREVLVRRYGRLIIEEKPLPDLILLDGGKGHLNSGLQVLRDLGLEDKVDLACIAKGKIRNDLRTDEIFLPKRKESVLFKEHSPARLLLQRIRDESHRFAIAYHRKLRNTKTLTSPLESISGIGKKRRLTLLKQFGSLENIRKASISDLTALPGITEIIAEKILEAIKVKNN
jgi:excinuclease ABC subunit C